MANNIKPPTPEEKIKQYESFLHKLNSYVESMDSNSVKELVENADKWSYLNKSKKPKVLVNEAFWKLCETPRANLLREKAKNTYTRYYE